jgi:Bacterial Ig-like domain
MKRFLLLSIPLLLLLLTACPEPTLPGGTKPTINSFTASPSSLPAGGGSVTLQWDVKDATSLSIKNSVGTVTGTSKTVNVTSNTTFTLTATNDSGSTTKSTSVSVGIDTNAPTVVSVDPPDGATGVKSDAIITITFSAAMDTEATQAAYQSTDLLPSDVSFYWSDDATVLEIEPTNFLEYARGSGTTFAAKQYAFSITDLAKDANGNSLSPFSSSFSTLRAVSNTCLGIVNLEGAAFSNSAVDLNGSVIEVGDYSDNGGVRGFFSFDLSTCLPPEGYPVSYAELNMYKIVTEGKPQELGFMTLEHLDYGDSLTSDDYAIPAFANVGIADIGSVLDRTWMTWPVMTHVQDDIANRATRGNRSQFRLSFASQTNNNNAFDVITFIATTLAGGSLEPFIQLEYLIP